jgi:hypothetical protein
VGSSTTAAGDPVAFSYSSGTMTAVIAPTSNLLAPPTQVDATAINASGQILLNEAGSGGLDWQYIVALVNSSSFDPWWGPPSPGPCNGRVTGIDTVFPRFYCGWALNDAGAAVGYLNACAGENIDYAWSSDASIGITLPSDQPPSRGIGINSSNTVVGYYTSPSGQRAFVSTPLVGPLDLNAAVDPGILQPGETLTSANAVNYAGVIVAVSNLGRSYRLTPIRWVTSYTPASLTFAKQFAGIGSAPKSVSYSNSTLAPVSIGSVTTPWGFTQTNNCGSMLAPAPVAPSLSPLFRKCRAYIRAWLPSRLTACPTMLRLRMEPPSCQSRCARAPPARTLEQPLL